MTSGEKPVEKYGADFGLDKPLDETILYEKVDTHIAKVILNRPERHNALFLPDMWGELRRKIDLGIQDDGVKVIILCANGKNFCAGDDLRRAPAEAFGLRPRQRLGQSKRILGMWNMRDDLFPATLYCPKTIIASCQGAVLAGGLYPALGAELLIASEDAYFAHPGMRIGFGGFEPALQLLLLRMGPTRAREFLLTTRRISAQEGKEWGFVNSVVPKDKLEEETMRFAKAVAAHSTDGLMIGRIQMHMFWDLMGMRASMGSAACLAHPLFTNMVWRDDEVNFLKYRSEHGIKEAFDKVKSAWADLGFD